MTNKSLIITIIALLVIGLGAWALYTMMQTPTTVTQINGNQTAAQKGTVYVSIADAAVNMGAVTAVDMTVDKVYLHSQDQGWVTVSDETKTYKLLAIKASGKSELVAKIEVPVDTYDQAWMHITKVEVTESGKVKEATLPSQDFKMNGTVMVTNGSTSAVELDVVADQSLHKTAKGEFIFAPVVAFESRSNPTINVDSNNMLTVVNGNVDSATNAGMDVDGQIKTNFKIDAATNLEINGGVISVPGVTGANGAVNGTVNSAANVNLGY